MSKEKWILFKNYLHNELGIRKDDIEQWTKQAIKEVAEEYVSSRLSPFMIREIAKKEVQGLSQWDIKTNLRSAILDNFEIIIKSKEKDNEVD
jgi:hypothetical protein